MFSSLIYWVVVGLGVLVTLIVLFTILVVWATMREHRARYRRPIISVCHIDNRVGVVLRSDLQKVSKEYWKPYFAGKQHYDAGFITAPDGRRMEVSPVFVFRDGSKEYYTLVYGCYVEQATFYVPYVSNDKPSPIGEAWQYVHGVPWKGGLIDW